MIQKIQLSNQRGTTMLEYVVMVAMIAIACISGVSSVGVNAADSFI